VVGVDHDVFGGDFVEQHPSGPVLEVSEEMVNTAPYVMLSQEVGEVWRLTPSAGVRYNHNDNFGDELGWQAGLKLAHGRLTLHAQFAHSFNYAGIYSAVLFGGTGFDTLEAEQIDHAEFGIQWRPLAGHAISVTAYQADVEDGIRVVVLPPPEYQNVGDYRTRGVELAYEAKLLPTVEIFIGGTYNDNDPEDLPYTPEWTAVAGLGWQFLDRWKFNATLSHFDEQWTGNPRSPAPNIEVDAYTLLNVRLDYRFTDRDGTRDGRFFVAGENVTDTDYELKPGYPMPGASVMTGIDVRF
jgi:iron complex outermembrane receptor protein